MPSEEPGPRPAQGDAREPAGPQAAMGAGRQPVPLTPEPEPGPEAPGFTRPRLPRDGSVQQAAQGSSSAKSP